MPRGRNLPDNQVAEALKKNAGNVAFAASALGMERTALHRRIAKSPALQEAKREADEIIVDMAEGVILRNLRDNNLTAAMYTLNNHPESKRRGWGPRTEVVGANGDALQIVIKYADA